LALGAQALVDSGASVSVISKKAFKSVWKHWKLKRLPLPASVTVSGVNGQKIDVNEVDSLAEFAF
jgi:hypothetical protein